MKLGKSSCRNSISRARRHRAFVDSNKRNDEQDDEDRQAILKIIEESKRDRGESEKFNDEKDVEDHKAIRTIIVSRRDLVDPIERTMLKTQKTAKFSRLSRQSTQPTALNLPPQFRELTHHEVIGSSLLKLFLVSCSRRQPRIPFPASGCRNFLFQRMPLGQCHRRIKRQCRRVVAAVGNDDSVRVGIGSWPRGNGIIEQRVRFVDIFPRNKFTIVNHCEIIFCLQSMVATYRVMCALWLKFWMWTRKSSMHLAVVEEPAFFFLAVYTKTGTTIHVLCENYSSPIPS